jgi:Tfp pilus assembly protein FimT
MQYPEAGNPRRIGGLGWGRRGNAGFSLLELLIITTFSGIIIAISLFGLAGAVNSARQRSAIAMLKQQISNAREMAISQQRDIKIEFIAPDQVRVSRINRPAGNPDTVLTDIRFEGGMTFSKLAGQPETPDAWGGNAAVAFDGATTLRFRSGDGALINQTDTLVNGRIFLAHNNGRVDTAGVVSVFGPTGRIRSYRLTGGAWSY